MSGLMGFEEAFRAADLAVRAVRSDGLRDIERVVLEGSWNRHTYQEIASAAGYTEGYLSRDVGPALWSVLSDALGMQVKKTNFRTAIERWSKERDAARANQSPSQNRSENRETVGANFPESALDALPFDVADFRGRETLLSELSDWILNDGGRLLCLCGIPGVGKTWLAVKLADQVRSQFYCLIYRDLSERPQPKTLVQDLLGQLSTEVPPELSFKSSLDLLVQGLTQQPCLLILDGAEGCYRPLSAGNYAPGFEEYGQILEAFAGRDHQSCILWVSRELPRSAAPMAGSSCRIQVLSGLSADELATLALWPETIEATAADWQYLSNHYGGIPALISAEIAPRLSSFGNSLEACLQALQWDNRFLSAYVETWLAALTEEEWQILTFMMICHRPLSLSHLNDYLKMTAPLSAIESLCDRGVCRSSMNGEPQWELALPKLLIPYLCDRFLANFQAADEWHRVALLHRYPLLQAEAPEMIRQWQRHTLLDAVSECLLAALPQLTDKQGFLQRAMAISQQLTQADQGAPLGPAPGYSAGNLMNLAQHWQVALVDLDLKGLQLREADLQSDLCQGISFAGADLSHTLLAKPLGQSPVIAVSPNQAQVAVGDRDGRLLLWNIEDGRLQRAMLNVSEAIRAIAYSPDGEMLAEGRQDGTVRLWDLRSEYGPELFATLSDGAPTRLVFSPDGQLLVGGDEDGYLYVWRLASGEAILRLQAHEASIAEIAVSPCSQRLITCGQDCAAVEWDLLTEQSISRFQGRLTNLLGTVAYLPDTSNSHVRPVVVGRDEGQLIIWDMASARPLRIMNKPCDLFMALALSPDGRYLAASDVTNKISVWNVSSRSRLYQISEPSAPVESLVFSPDGRDLMTGCDYTVQRWQVQSGQCLRIWRSDRHPANKLALATSPLQLLSSHDDHTLRCWQFSTRRRRWLPQERLQVPSDSPISHIATSAHGNYRAIGTEAGHIHVWHRERQNWLTWSMRLPSNVTALTFNLEGTRLAAGDATGTVALWDLSDHIFRWQKHQTHADSVTALAFAPDGQRLFSGSRDRTIQSWDLQGHPLPSLTGHRRRVHTLCVSEDGQTLYSGSYDGTVCSWDLRHHTCLRTWQRRDRYIHWLTLDAQQRPVVIISDTQTLELWDLIADTCRSTFTAQEETIWHVSTNPDGSALVCATQSGQISIWSLTSGDRQGELRVDRPYEGMQIGGCLGLTDSERQMLYSLGATDY